MALLVTSLLLAALVGPTSSSSSSGTSAESILTFCSGHQSHNFTSSPGDVTSGELAGFLDAVSAGAYGVAHMSHNMSWHIAGTTTNRTLYGVAQCRPDVPVPDCAACLAVASSHLISRRTACAASSAAIWHDACYLRYSDDRDASVFREDEYTATVFNATRALLSPQEEGKAAVRRLLAAAVNSTTSSHMCRAVGAGSDPVGRMHGLARCAAGVSCDDCRRCLRGAVAAVEREYNGSAGMQVLRLSCMARYESYPFYSTASLPSNPHTRYDPIISTNVTVNGRPLNMSPSPTAAAPPPPATPGGHTTTHTKPAEEAPPAGGTGGGAPPPPPPPADAQNPSPALFPADPPPPPPAATPPNNLILDQTRVTQQSHVKTPKTKTMLIIIITITTGLVAGLLLLVLIISSYRRKQPPAQKGRTRIIADSNGMRRENMYDHGEEQWSKEEEDEDGERTSCQLYSYQVLEAATHHFSNSNKLGSGGFGTVFKGTLENGKEGAVKRLKDSKRNIQNLEREISIVSNLRHKNLVRFLGYCFQEEGRFLVYEYVPNNSLEKFWYKACFQSQKLEWATWFNIIKGVARGLRFLHDKGIIHRDLKPHNVLLDENFNPKIADFDLMRMYDKQKTHESTEKVAGTFGYMAPECTSGRKFLLSIKSDVYSYGVLVLEIITGHKIYTFEGQNSEGLVEYVWQHWTEKRAADIVDGDLGVDGEERAAHQALRCVHVALLCVQSDRARRPTMGQVIAMLSTDEALQEPSLPGYVVFRPTAASGPVWLPCLGCR
ncbi:unnamed protein product [Urochloa decumbens]|uniref:Cysteine-rich receptor-like protein kinase 25 n=1 Tax=Urochloa decumbens TaxID=240449 RepID=A0ABC9CBN6_9POAL